jgi:hypothetical protein
LAARDQRVRSSAGSKIGAATRRARRASIQPPAPATAKDPSVAADAQPHVCPCTSARAIAPVAPASSAAPGTSGRAVSAARDSRSTRSPTTTVAIPAGMLITKIQRQVAPSLSRPPIGGPSAAATDPTAPQPAITAAQRCGGNAASRRPSAAGIIAAAAMPWIARAATSTPTEGARAHTAEAAANSETPAR